MTYQLILGSQSPRRKDLLRQIGLSFTIRTSPIDEQSMKIADPTDRVMKLAKMKNDVIEIADNEVILTADTIVTFENAILEKPMSKADARRMLEILSGKTHHVLTGVAIRSQFKEKVFAVKTAVEFWPLSNEEINWYIETDEPYDKAGAYGIQGLAGMFIKQIIGDYFNVVGLPISQVARTLREFEISIY